MKYRILEQLQSALVKRKLIIFEIFLCNKVTFINRISGGTAKKIKFQNSANNIYMSILNR